MIINKDFKEFIESLNAHKVDFLLIGGYALAFYGYPRFTQDIDIWIWTDKQNVDSLLEAIKDFGFASIQLENRDFSEGDNVVQLGFPPNRIDIVTVIDGVRFTDAFKNRNVYKSDDIEVPIISLDDLIKNKRASGRTRDIADAEELEKLRDAKEE